MDEEFLTSYNRVKFESLGEKFKNFENEESLNLDVDKPILLRLDGKSFHVFTNRFQKPYDEQFGKIMVETARYLFELTRSVLGYVQSDEISLLLSPSHIEFNGRKLKLCSIYSSYASVFFNKFFNVQDSTDKDQMELNRKTKGKIGIFDCRAFNLNSTEEIKEYFLWRMMDCNRNSISNIYRSLVTKNVEKKNHKELLDTLNNIKFLKENPKFDEHYLNGTYFRRCVIEKKLDQHILNKIPEKFKPVKDQIYLRNETHIFYRRDFDEEFRDILKEIFKNNLVS